MLSKEKSLFLRFETEKTNPHAVNIKKTIKLI